MARRRFKILCPLEMREAREKKKKKLSAEKLKYDEVGTCE